MHTSKRCGDAVTIVVVWSCETSLELRINKRSQFPSRGIDPSLPRRAIYSSDASAPSLLHLFGARLSTTIARHTSHVTRHTSHVTRLRSLVTHHTSHVTRYPPALGFTAKMLIMQHSIGRQCFSRSATSALRSTISNCATSFNRPLVTACKNSWGNKRVTDGRVVGSTEARHMSQIVGHTSHITHHTSHRTFSLSLSETHFTAIAATTFASILWLQSTTYNL